MKYLFCFTNILLKTNSVLFFVGYNVSNVTGATLFAFHFIVLL